MCGEEGLCFDLRLLEKGVGEKLKILEYTCV